MLPTIHSPLALLFAKIKAEMVANGTPFADASAEIAFRGWLQSAWVDSGCTQDFACLYQPDSSDTISVGIRVGFSGNKVNVWWGDGTSDSYAPDTDSNTTVSKTYGSLARRPVVILGRITYWEGPSQAYGGRLWDNLRSLTYLYCWNCSLLTGSIDNLPVGLTVLSCVGCWLLTGSIDNLPVGLTYIDCGNCSLLTGSIDNLPAGLTAIYCWNCSLLTGSIDNLPAGLTVLSCVGCSLFTYSGRSWADGMSYIYISPSTGSVFTSAMTDALLIDTSMAVWSGQKTLTITGTAGAPTSAADAAIGVLIAQGVNVTTN